MKRILIVLLSLLIAVFFAGCGTYTPPTGGSGRPSTGTDGSPNNGENPDGDDGGGEEGYVFTVTLVDAPSVYPEDLEAIWTGKNEVHSARFIDGVATAEGLNGEYHVTLSKMLDGYTYDCNGYNADNGNKDIEITLLPIIPLKGYVRLAPNGESEIHWYEISKYGTYRATIKSATDSMGFMFEPEENGNFNIQSWCDATANQINPTLRVYNGTSSYCTFREEIYDGGASGTFTKNFKYSTSFADENIGAVQLFVVKANVNNIEYPVNVDFTISREGDYELPDYSGEPYYATGPFYRGSGTGTWHYIYRDNYSVSGGETYYIQDEDKVTFNPEDGFYHVGNADGPLLYARLIRDCEVFATIYMERWINRGFFWNELADGLISLTLEDGYNYSYMVNQGYAEYCDVNGAHPVTEEIKRMLQGYASNQNLFFDGEGLAEDPLLNANNYTNPGGIRLQSDEDSMWLFACGYYS